ncbi:60S ribosomal protein L33B [Entomophthora muscae]|uniref:60S ribosomal protein L33B n=2 Tax=Entomophthora muscae TaxID=34485 RepID=A0ACC2TH14_9FUNG|nr:60S ribosomal protein L33B [Entomophthora muscae]KAJ9086081.1 60S ribosomal protein L33B [Entomophthora muscae]
MTRLHVNGRILGHKRALRNSDPNTSIIGLEGVNNKEDCMFYLGKRVAWVYKATKVVKGSKYRVIWGRITRPHGNTGKVKAKFTSNLPVSSFGQTVRVMLYPSRI